MNQREMQRVTTPSLPRPGEDQKTIITKTTDAFKEVFKRDGDKEQRLRILESERGHGVTRTTVDALLAARFQLPPVYVSNAAAIAGGLAIGDYYRSGGDPDVLCVVH